MTYEEMTIELHKSHIDESDRERQAKDKAIEVIWKAKRYDDFMNNNIDISTSKSINNELIVKVDYSDILQNSTDIFIDTLVAKIVDYYEKNKSNIENGVEV